MIVINMSLKIILYEKFKRIDFWEEKSSKKAVKKAVKRDDIQAVKALIAAGADVNWRYFRGWSETNEKEYYGLLEIVCSDEMKFFLIEQGAR